MIPMLPGDKARDPSVIILLSCHLFLAFRFVFGDFRVFATFCFLVKCMLGWEGLMVLLSFVS